MLMTVSAKVAIITIIITTRTRKSLSYEFSFTIISFVRVILHCLTVILVPSDYLYVCKRIEINRKILSHVEIRRFHFQ